MYKQDQFQQVLQKYVDLGFPGVSALIYTPEHGLWQGTAGYARVEDKQAVENCHVFHSGSIAKLYTVVAALQMVESGKLELDAKISQYLPNSITSNLPNGDLATVRQLMGHQTGIPDHDDEEELNDYINANNGALPAPEAQMAYLYDNAPLFVPGDSVSYSSANTVLLALILDAISDGSHADLISKNIIEALNLKSTYYKNETGYPKPGNLVNGYAHDFEGKPLFNLSTAASNYSQGSHGDAGIIASAYDYYRFLQGIVEAELISDTTLTQMTTPGLIADISEDFYIAAGLGLLIYANPGKSRYGHSGATVGSATNVFYYPENGSYLVTLTNFTPEFSPMLIQQFYGSGLIGEHSSFIGELEALFLP